MSNGTDRNGTEETRLPKRSYRIDDALYTALKGYAITHSETPSMSLRRILTAALVADGWGPTQPLEALKRRAAAATPQTNRALRDDDMLSLSEAAKRFDLSRSTIYAWMRAGKLTPILRPGGTGERAFQVGDLRVAIEEMHKNPYVRNKPRRVTPDTEPLTPAAVV